MTDGIEKYLTSPRYFREEISKLAMNTTWAVSTEAEETGTHTPGSWTKEGMAHHLEHVLVHADRAYRIESQSNQEKREELTHMLCRAAMALWSFDQGIYEDAGVEGKGS